MSSDQTTTRIEFCTRVDHLIREKFMGKDIPFSLEELQTKRAELIINMIDTESKQTKQLQDARDYFARKLEEIS